MWSFGEIVRTMILSLARDMVGNLTSRGVSGVAQVDLMKDVIGVSCSTTDLRGVTLRFLWDSTGVFHGISKQLDNVHTENTKTNEH